MSAAVPRPLVLLKGASLTYGGAIPVTAIDNASLAVEAGDYVTVMGPSGAGKSSFLNIIGLLDSLSSGDYFFDGRRVDDLSEGDRTSIRGRSIGFVFQSFHLLDHRDVLENVELAMLYNGTPRKGRTDRARDILSRVGLDSRMDYLPSHLSGGERQRVAIARALVGSPQLLLCDEPTGNLDSLTAQKVLSLIDDLQSELALTVIVITHDPTVAARGKSRYEIRDGRVVQVARESRAGE